MLSANRASHTTSRSWSGNSRPNSRRTHRLRDRQETQVTAYVCTRGDGLAGVRHWHAVDLRGDLQPVEVHVQFNVVLLHQLVLDAVDFGHDGNRWPGVLGPGEGNAGQHLFFTLREEIIMQLARRYMSINQQIGRLKACIDKHLFISRRSETCGFSQSVWSQKLLLIPIMVSIFHQFHLDQSLEE